jgi:hypothetical protein
MTKRRHPWKRLPWNFRNSGHQAGEHGLRVPVPITGQNPRAARSKATIRLLRGRRRSEMESPIHLGVGSQAVSNPNRAKWEPREARYERRNNPLAN